MKRPRPILIFSQLDYLIQIVDINSHTQWQTVQIQAQEANWSGSTLFAADPVQLASSEANWSASTLFAKAGHIWVQQNKG